MQIKKLFPVNEYILANILLSLLNKANLLRNKIDETLLDNIQTYTIANQKQNSKMGNKCLDTRKLPFKARLARSRNSSQKNLNKQKRLQSQREIIH